jgi:hypothetical protein
MNTSSNLQKSVAAPAPIYAHGRNLDTQDKAAQLRKLALVGIAATDSTMNLLHLDDALQGLFEVMHRLAGEVEEEVDEMLSLGKRAAA